MSLEQDKLEFTEEGHIYKYKNTKIPSVSTLLEPITDYSSIDPNVLEQAAFIGTQVHKLIEYEFTKGIDLKKVIEDNQLPEKILNGVRAWLDVKERFGIEIIKSEEKKVFELNKQVYAGTIDCIGKVNKIFNSDNAIIDFKTTSVLDEEKTAVQLSFYSQDNKDVDLFVCHLDKYSGIGSLIKLKRNDKMCRSLIEIYKYKNK